MGFGGNGASAGKPAGYVSDVFVFFAVVVGVNLVFVGLIAEEILPRFLFPRGRFYLLGLILIAVVFLMRGPRAVWGIFAPLFVWRFNPLWIVAAAVWPFLFAFLFTVGKIVITGSEWEIFSRAVGLLSQPRLLVTIFVAALVGEIVWIGYALRTLGQRYPKILAAIMTGIAWTLWWMPMVYFNVGVFPDLTWTGLTLNMIGIVFFCTFFYSITGSGLSILAMQTCYACSILTFPVMPKSGGPLTYELYAILYFLTGLFFVTMLLPWIQKQEWSPRGVALGPEASQ